MLVLAKALAQIVQVTQVMRPVTVVNFSTSKYPPFFNRRGIFYVNICNIV